MYIPVVYVAICVYFFATALATLGHVGMKLHTNEAGKKSKHFWKYRFLLCALLAYVSGGVIDLSVNRFIPFYVRACFAALDIPIYAVLARFLLGEVMDSLQLLGVVVAVAGCSSAVLAGAQPVHRRTEAEVLGEIFSERVALLLATTLPVFALSVWTVKRAVGSSELHLHTATNLGRLSLLSAAVFSSSYTAVWASLLVRCVSELAQFGLFDPSTIATATLLVLTCIAQVATLADMMSLFESIVSIPPYLILNAAGLAIYSAIIFKETPNHPYVFFCALAVAFAGICLIVHKPPAIIQVNFDDEKRILLATDTEETDEEAVLVRG